MRADGGVGVRNHILVIPTVICANRAAMRIADLVAEAVPVPHIYGCSFDEEQDKRTVKTLIGFGNNPNVGAVIVVSLGCETVSDEVIASAISDSGKPVELLKIQSEGGVERTAAKGASVAQRFLADLRKQRRVECDISELMVATECGGSDGYSGVSANPAVGTASDMVVAEGGTVILSEVSEMIGAEHILAGRAVNERVAEDLLRVISTAARSFELSSEKGGVYITPGNIEGGLTTIEEKSLGCIHKGGTSPISEVVRYAERPSRKGLVVMDTPGYDVASVTGMVAGGAQIVLFTTGRGTPTGCPIAPVIKIASNARVYETMKDDIDINAGTIVDGEETIQGVGKRIFEMIIKVASGHPTSSEQYKYQEFAVAETGFPYLKLGCTERS